METNAHKKDRHSFVVVDHTPVFQRDGDFRSVKAWVRDDRVDIHADDFEDVLRGTYDMNGICFFKGDNYVPVLPFTIPKLTIEAVYHEYVKRYGYRYCDLPIWTGMEMGEPGTLWFPRRIIGIYSAHGEVYTAEGRPWGVTCTEERRPWCEI